MNSFIPLTSKQLDEMNPAALHNIVVCMNIAGGDILVSSLFDIIAEEEYFQSISPSEALKAFIGNTSGNECEILVVYGPGGWFKTTLADD